MAEANSTPLSEAELEQVRSILQPLSKNPDISEELNPMLSVFRQKMGYGTQMSSHDDEDIEEETESNSDFEEGEEEFAQSESPQRPPTKVFEDDDIDLDELLAEPGQAPTASPPTDDFSFEEEPSADSGDPFADFGMDSEPASDSLDDFGLPETSPTSDSDDFSFGEESTQNADTSDPFGDLAESTSEDPFSGTDFSSEPIDDFSSTPTTSSDLDPFADTFTSTPDTSGDPFADMGSLETSTSSGEDDFGLSGSGSDNEVTSSEPSPTDDDFFSQPIDSEPSSTETDPFADFGDLGSPASGGQDPFSDLSSSATVSEDPFADFVPSTEEDTLSDIVTGADASFDTFSPDLESDTGGGDFDSGSSFGLEADLQGLASEEKEEIDKGLKDEELAIIQKEILRYPPTLRRAVIDAIVQDKLTPRDQKGLLELIKIESSPEEIADFLSGVLGEPVSVSQRMSGFSRDGVPIISTDPIYTKEGLQRQKN